MTRADDRVSRVVIEGVEPEIDKGRFPIKRVVGENVDVEADIFADGHEVLSAVLRFRHVDDRRWKEVSMEALPNDRWAGSFQVAKLGRYEYSIRAWIDRFLTWQRDLSRKVEAGQDVSVDLLSGGGLLDELKYIANEADSRKMGEAAEVLKSRSRSSKKQVQAALDERLSRVASKYAALDRTTDYGKVLEVVVDPEKARFSTWYELFPRSCGPDGRHGTFDDCEPWLRRIAGMGFDVLYLPPIHPIGTTNRKGKNNALRPGEDDPGTPWAIGSQEGGHRAVHPSLGTLDDFRRFVASAREKSIDIALDIAFQCSPDHPYVKEHPEWFIWRPDGTVQYAENPPKKYEDIYPLNFETEQWRELWQELKSVFEFWIDQGVKIFRVDNPHTKPFAFWEWLIGELKGKHPDLIFLAEAFTRPKIMYRLAKLGFSQSYTYFAWRNTKWELTQYFTELYETEVKEFFRPSLWTNTPDILTEYLQTGGRPAFMTRLVLAATLSASYGMYGPAFELLEDRPRSAGSEEYLNSEKYELKDWDLDRADSLAEFITLVNRIRRENQALQANYNVCFHSIPNDELLCYSKRTEDGTNAVLVVVNLDPRYTQSGWVDLNLDELGVEEGEPFEMRDLITGARYEWHGPRNYVELNPHQVPAHILRPHQSGPGPTQRSSGS